MSDLAADRQSSKLLLRAAPVVAIGIGAAVAAVVLLWAHMRSSETDRPTYQNLAVAILEMQPRTQTQADQWLAPALTEMLGTELSAADEIRVIPNSVVHEASGGVKAQPNGGYALEQLAELRRRLNADFIISGRYHLSDSGGDSPLSVTIDLQDARTGTAVAAIVEQGSLTELTRLANHLGAELRAKLGASRVGKSRLNQISSIQPPTTAVAERVGFALDAMARHDSARARDELLEAVAEAPDYSPSYLYLSQAWAALGYRQRALEAARQAASRSSSAPVELRLQIEATVQSDDYDAKQAAGTWRRLVMLRPQMIEYRLAMVKADIDAGDTQGAEAAIDELRRLPPAPEDPRTELAASLLARVRSDVRSQVQHAQMALRLAQVRQSSGLAADARVALADAQIHLGEFDAAKEELDEALAGYHQMENPSGEVSARRLQAEVFDAQMHHREALEEYQHAIALAETIGDAGNVGAIYRGISAMLWYQGDREGAQASARRALEVSRTTGDLPLQSWTLRALATIASDEAATDEVLKEYQEVTALTESSHDLGGHVWSLATSADILRMRGQLNLAQASCVRAQAEASALTDPQFRIYSDFVCASVAIDRGEPDTALLLLENLEQLSKSSGNAVYEANAEFLTGQIEFDAGHYAKAQEHYRRARERYKDSEGRTGEANAEALLALCAHLLNDPAERDRAAAQARNLRLNISSRQEIYVIDIALARLSAPDLRTTTIDGLRKLAADAEGRHWIGWSLESQLAEWQILKERGDGPAASEVRSNLEATARALGFKRIVSLLNSVQPSDL